MNESVEVHIDLSDPASQVFKVDIFWHPQSNRQTLTLPIWTPGSYTVRDHVQYLYGLKAEQDNKNIAIKRLDTSQWSIEIDLLNPISLSYFVEARNNTVRTCYLDPDFASLCLAAAVIQIVDFRWSPHLLKFSIPPNWTIYTPLIKKNVFFSEDYDELIDSPVHAGILKANKLNVRKSQHDFILVGEQKNILPEKFLEDVSSICRAVCKLMDDDPPSGDRYQFILQLMENGYGGLEHDFSSFLQYSWRELHTKKGYRRLLQLIGHEYLHQWNVRRLRPQDYFPYDYNNSIISDSLWFAEGITSYYDLTFPFIAKISNLNDLIEDISEEIIIFLDTPGRFIQSLSDSSREAWIKLYKSVPASKDSQISYYRLGTLLAFCLDVRLRLIGSSLSNLLRYLWLKHGDMKRPYSRQDILLQLSMIDRGITQDLSLWLDTPGSLPILSTIRSIGFKLEFTKEKSNKHGLTLSNNNNHFIITRIERNSPAFSSDLVIDDELIAIDGRRIVSCDDFNEYIVSKSDVNIDYFRRGILRNSRLDLNNDKISYKKRISIDLEASEDCKNLRNKWLEFI